MIFHLDPPSLAPAWLHGFSPDGRWLLFWEDSLNSASLAADGLPLVALPVSGGKPITITGELHYSDFLTWCGKTLVYVLNHGGRQVTLGDGIVAAAPPNWRARTILPPGGKTSWNSRRLPDRRSRGARRRRTRCYRGPDVAGRAVRARTSLPLDALADARSDATAPFAGGPAYE